MCTCSVTTAHNPLDAFMGFILCFFLFIPLFFFACYTTPRRTSFHSTFWTYLPFCASYKCLGCLSLSLLLTWDDFACQLACKWLCRCCWPAKVLYEMREVPRKSGKKSRCCCRCCLKPTHKAKQNKVQPSNNKISDQTGDRSRAVQSRPSATLQLWLRPTTLMTEGHSRAIRRPDDEETSTHSNLR